MPNYTNHKIPLSDLVPEEFQGPKWRAQLNAMLNAKAGLNRLNGKDDKDIDDVETLIEGDLVVVNGNDSDAKKFINSVKATSWK